MSPVVLRPAEHFDAPALLAANQRSKSLHHPWVSPCLTQQQFDEWLARTKNGAAVHLIGLTDGEIAGVASFSQIFMGGFRNAYLGFYGVTGFQHRGLMTQVVRLAVRHAFSAIGLHRVEANIQPDNVRSIELVRRLGFRKEGFSPDYLMVDGQWRDHERWALLSTDKLT